MTTRELKQHIVAYPFLHTPREIFEYFQLTYSAFVIRETHIIAYINSHTNLFCSPRCAWFNLNDNIELSCKAYHMLFKNIEVLQQYCYSQRCCHCRKLLCVLDNSNLYAEPMYDFSVETFEIKYSELLRFHTVHH